jgi:hypothetical protein
MADGPATTVVHGRANFAPATGHPDLRGTAESGKGLEPNQEQEKRGCLASAENQLPFTARASVPRLSLDLQAHSSF